MHRVSYWKTIAPALAVAAASLAGLVATNAVHVSGLLGSVAGVFGTMALLASSLIVCGGAVCLWRDGRIESGKCDPIGASLNRVPSAGLLATLGLRSLLGNAPRPGDIVAVKSLGDIQSTLDADSALEGLPFMPEMHAYCGLTFGVHRRVDKIWDMRHKTGLRRLCNAVTLIAVRCNGAHHGGCQAQCQILWKDAWLRRLPTGVPEGTRLPADTAMAPDADAVVPDTYVCQMTRLWEASQPMSRFDIRLDLRPLLSGNVRLWAYVLVLLTRLFNTIQSLRGGVGFPSMPDRTEGSFPAPLPQQGLTVGQSVVVQDRAHISQTLTNSRSRGLWYDHDMVRFCGNGSVVQQRVDHLIHEATGKMVKMKTTSWILRDMTATGEFHRLCPQNEHIHWREAWLRPQTMPLEPPTPGGLAGNGH
jgi:hypothetical protein